MTMTPVNVQRLIDELRAAGHTAATIALAVGCSPRTVEGWARGKGCRLFGAVEKLAELARRKPAR